MAGGPGPASERMMVGAEDRRRQVECGLTDLLYRNLPLGLLCTVAISLLLACGMIGQKPTSLILAWFGGCLAVSAARFGLWAARTRGRPESTESRKWQIWFEIGATTSGMLWGIAAISLFPQSSLPHQVFLGFVLAIVAAGAIGTLGMHLRTYALYLLPSLVPYTVQLLLTGGDLQVLMAALFMLGLVVLLVSARRFQEVTINAFSLRSENDRLVEALRSALREAERASSAKSAFLTNMSHEIRTPMNGVLGIADLLLKTDLTARQNHLASTLSQSAKSLLAIVNDILDFSRIEAGKVELDRQVFDLRASVENAMDLCAEVSYRKGLEINLIVADTLPANVEGDPARVRQVLINLIANAIKFTMTGEIMIRVSTTIAADGRALVRFVVSDTGIGIASNAKRSLFVPFAQADSSITRQFGGTGLGLAITRHLVDLMEGSISIDSELGSGTTVEVVIPFEICDQKQPADMPAAPSLDGKRVLIVDDRPTSREMIAINLSGTGAELAFADGMSSAISLLEQSAVSRMPYDYLIVDRLAPRTDNIDLRRRIRSDVRFASIGVVALMPLGWRGNKGDEPETGTTRNLTKPARRSDLLAALLSTRDTSAIPAERAEQVDAPATANRYPHQDLGLRVLLAEDNPVNQEVALEYLRELGCSVTLAENGQQAIDNYSCGTFDIVLLDCQMPEIDGLTAARKIRDLERQSGTRRTPMLAITANAYEGDRQQALEAGMDDYLTKPFTSEELAAVLRRLAQPNRTEQSAPIAAA